MKYYLIFTSWSEDLKKVSFVRLLRDRGGMSFLDAKRLLEAFLLGEETILDVSDLDLAKMLKKESAKLGAKSKLITTRTSKIKRVLQHA